MAFLNVFLQPPFRGSGQKGEELLLLRPLPPGATALPPVGPLPQDEQPWRLCCQQVPRGHTKGHKVLSMGRFLWDTLLWEGCGSPSSRGLLIPWGR